MSATQTANLERPNAVSATINGTDYGLNEILAKSRNITVPPGIDELVQSVHGKSKLLAMTTTGATRQTTDRIYRAYGADIEMLHKLRVAFKRTIEAAVRARADALHIDAQATLDRVVTDLPDLESDTKLQLGPEAAMLPPAELLERLQTEFRTDVENMSQGLVMWLNALVDRDVISVLQWHNPAAVTYNFFWLHSQRGPTTTKTVDPGMHRVGRNVTHTDTTNVRVTEERREHTILNAERHRLDGYVDKVPNRIALLINSIPEEVKPFVTIVDGHVSQEKVTQRVNEHVDTVTRSVWVRDPAPVLFGTYALAGWGGSAVEPSNAVYDGHPQQRANNWLTVSLILSMVFAALAVPLGGGRAAILALLIGLVLTGAHQLSIRTGQNNRPNNR